MGLSLSKNMCAKTAEVVEQSLTPNGVEQSLTPNGLEQSLTPNGLERILTPNGLEKILNTGVSKINDNIQKTLKEITITTENTDSVVFSIIEKIKSRADVGMEKYKTNLDRQDLSTVDWIIHAQEELMDAILYLEKLKQIESKKDVLLFELSNTAGIVDETEGYANRMFTVVKDGEVGGKMTNDVERSSVRYPIGVSTLVELFEPNEPSAPPSYLYNSKDEYFANFVPRPKVKEPTMEPTKEPTAPILDLPNIIVNNLIDDIIVNNLIDDVE